MEISPRPKPKRRDVTLKRRSEKFSRSATELRVHKEPLSSLENQGSQDPEKLKYSASSVLHPEPEEVSRRSRSPKSPPSPLYLRTPGDSPITPISPRVLRISKEKETKQIENIYASQQSIDKLFDQFLSDYPEWKESSHLDQIIKEEYDFEKGVVYLDYTGASIFARTQMEKYTQLVCSKTFGNPHSINRTSTNSTELDHEARHEILSFFGADPNEYSVIFTSNASSACKLVAESFPFGPKKALGLLSDNHNSLVGMREFAQRQKAQVEIIHIDPFTGRFSEQQLREELSKIQSPGLFCYPAQSNWSGIQHPLEFIEIAQQLGWRVLLDAAAFVGTNLLDLSKWKPDFIPLSFYKMFGFPTGMGCLIAKKEALASLNPRPWFSGGTVTVVSINSKMYGHYKPEDPHYWEDGTPNFLSTAAVTIGLKHLTRLGLDNIHNRVIILSSWLIDQMSRLKFTNGTPLVTIYGATNSSTKSSETFRGGVVTFNLFDWKKRTIPVQIVDKQALKFGLCVRTGCFCNPGASEELLGYKRLPFVICLGARSYNGKICPKDVIMCGNGRPIGAVRVSFGIASRWEDAVRLLEFLSCFLNERVVRIWRKEHLQSFKIPDSLC